MEWKIWRCCRHLTRAYMPSPLLGHICGRFGAAAVTFTRAYMWKIWRCCRHLYSGIYVEDLALLPSPLLRHICGRFGAAAVTFTQAYMVIGAFSYYHIVSSSSPHILSPSSSLPTFPPHHIFSPSPLPNPPLPTSSLLPLLFPLFLPTTFSLPLLFLILLLPTSSLLLPTSSLLHLLTSSFFIPHPLSSHPFLLTSLPTC